MQKSYETPSITPVGDAVKPECECVFVAEVAAIAVAVAGAGVVAGALAGAVGGASFVYLSTSYQC